MDFVEIVTTRYAAKRFDGTPLPAAEVERLLDLIRMAPTAYNLQPWRVVVIPPGSERAALAEAAWGQAQIESCSHLLVFCANTALEELAIAEMSEVLATVRLHEGPADEALRRLVIACEPISPYLALLYSQSQEDPDTCIEVWSEIDSTITDLFLRGQQDGVFRPELPAAWLTETFYSLVAATDWSIRAGRVAAPRARPVYFAGAPPRAQGLQLPVLELDGLLHNLLAQEVGVVKEPLRVAALRG